MTTLFIITNTTMPDSIIPHEGDGMLLAGDAVSLAFDAEFTTLFSGIPLHVVDDDLQLRGLSIDGNHAINVVSYHDMVKLTILHHQIQTC